MKQGICRKNFGSKGCKKLVSGIRRKAMCPHEKGLLICMCGIVLYLNQIGKRREK